MNMNRTIVAFIVLVVMIFSGIGILMNPSILVTFSVPSAVSQTADNNPRDKSTNYPGFRFYSGRTCWSCGIGIHDI
jgi:hypothetical protein